MATARDGYTQFADEYPDQEELKALAPPEPAPDLSLRWCAVLARSCGLGSGFHGGALMF